MKASTWLRIASVLTLIHFAGHTFDGMLSEPRHGVGEIILRQAMKSYRLDVMGRTRSYWDFYYGFGLYASAALLLTAVLMWQLSMMVKTSPEKARPFIATLFIAFVAFAVLDWFYFFTIPLVFTIAVALCLGMAFVSAKRVHKES